MPLLKGKHVIADLEGTRCSVVESGITPERVAFLKELLTLNGYVVKTEKEKAKDGTETGNCTIGVTDILAMPVVLLYEKKLRRSDGQVVTPAYWNQWPGDEMLPYWQVTR